VTRLLIAILVALVLSGCASVGYVPTVPEVQRLSGYVTTFVLYREQDKCFLRVTYKDHRESKIAMDREVCTSAAAVAAVSAPKGQ
jgi:hypothetical protein